MPIAEEVLLPWHAQSTHDVMAAFETSNDGLLELEAKKRIREYGRNELPPPLPRQAWKILLAQFASPLMGVLLVAAAISALLAEFLDVGVIVTAIGLNVILGFVEEYKADRSWQALKRLLPVTSRVMRSGSLETINAAELVPGDLVVVRAGDSITADGRLIQGSMLEVDESILTGESAPVTKSTKPDALEARTPERHSMVSAGTKVVAGSGTFVVTATGSFTELGRVSSLVTTVREQATPLETQLARLSKKIGLLVLVLAAIVFITGLLRGVPMLDMFRIAVALAVAAIPEGLLIAFTVILAIGMQRILRRRGLVRRLVATETLGSVSVICADKTGTLTEGRMAVDEIRVDGKVIAKHLSDDASLQELRAALYFSNHASLERDPDTGDVVVTGSPTDVAIMRHVLTYRDIAHSQHERSVGDLPFDSSRKFAARLVMRRSGPMLYVLGAPEFLFAHLKLGQKAIRALRDHADEMASRGLRVLLVASAKGDAHDELTVEGVKDLSPLALIGLADPVRPDVAGFILEAREAGIIPIMITGDHPETATAVAAQVGLPVGDEHTLTGAQLDELSEKALMQRVRSISIYARVSPEQKLRIVRAWQRLGKVVAMTGDGVNDAPSIKAADMGIALGEATTVTKETADLVLLDSHFKTIVFAIREGRVIFENMRKTLVYLLSDSFSEIILVLGAILMGVPVPILPAQILWINLITDGLPSAALAFEPAETGIMKESPRQKSEPIMNRQMVKLIFIVSFITDLGLLGIYLVLLHQDFSLEAIRTFMFVALGLDSLFYVFAVRKLRTGIFSANPFENRPLVIAVILGFALQILPLVIPSLRSMFGLVALPLAAWGVLVAMACVKLLIIEAVKVAFLRPRARMIPV